MAWLPRCRETWQVLVEMPKSYLHRNLMGNSWTISSLPSHGLQENCLTISGLFIRSFLWTWTPASFSTLFVYLFLWRGSLIFLFLFFLLTDVAGFQLELKQDYFEWILGLCSSAGGGIPKADWLGSTAFHYQDFWQTFIFYCILI